MSFSDVFRNPGCAYRGKPFWAWNGKLERSELLRQLAVFKEMGLGGAFIHARSGLKTPYLSKEWFKLVAACAEQAATEGLETWLYDEDRWPSGAAGGIVTKDKRHRMRFLRLDALSTVASFRPTGRELALFKARLSGRSATDVRRLKREMNVTLRKSESLLVFTEEPFPLLAAFNGYTYLDTMNEGAVARFIEVTHAQYLKHNGGQFGKAIPGIFTDEPNYGSGRVYDSDKGSGTAPWTAGLPAKFRKRHGYDLLDHLPELFFVVEGSRFSQARLDYRDCLTHLFVNAFARKIYEFCEKAGLEFTGHVLEEPTLIRQTQAVGAAMRFYEYMHAPGVDILGTQGLSRAGADKPEFTSVKQCESVRRQFGRKRMLSEMYGCTGWNFNFAEHKAVGDWQAALGVNLRCQHHAWYTMEGEAKRDYPASISHQSAWWRSYRTVEDYFARLHVALALGETVRDVAVLHPIESVWGTFIIPARSPGHWYGNPATNPIAQALDGCLSEIQAALLRAHCDFDYVDEDILARHGSVTGVSLKVNLASYRAVVVPPMLRVRESTADLLARFVQAGGKLLRVESPGELALHEQPGGLAVIKELGRRVKLGALAETLARAGLRGVSVRSRASGREYADCLCQWRRDDKTGVSVVFITHNRQDRASGELEVEIPARGRLFELDAATGRIERIDDATSRDGRTRLRTSLAPCGSRLFVSEAADSILKADAGRKRFVTASSKFLKLRDCDYALSEPNAVALDLAEATAGEQTHGPFEVLKLDGIMRATLGLPPRNDLFQPWARRPDRKRTPGNAVRITYGFQIETMPPDKLWLVLERPGEHRCALNGKSLPLHDQGWWLDHAFRKIAIPAGALNAGWNTLTLTTTYTAEAGIEAVYLLGAFSARRDACGMAVLSLLPERIGLGDWARYGLGSFTGAVSYSLETGVPAHRGGRVVLKLGRWEGVVVRVLVDGQDAGCVAWPPHELDITEAVAGKRRVRLELALHAGRRNLLGPLHADDCCNFRPGLRHWRPAHVSLPAGLMETPRLIVRCARI
ncbi:MAG: glycosyl hydrolase [Kiritimatiellae bacterium]|nr:glycosyl hydrolase [Kiritimatiellia bacterium]